MIRRLLLMLVFLGPATVLVATSARPQATEARKPMLIEGMTQLYQRVIARPGATLSPARGPAGAKPVAGFSVFYVYGRQEGWVEVGSAADGRTQGWMPEEKTIEWRHTMIAAFTNPAGRQPVLFLGGEADERRLMLDRDAGTLADQMRVAALAHNPGPVVAMEPPNMVDISRNFYLLPILRADLVEREVGPPLRLLKVISAPADAPATNQMDERAALRNYKAAVVFVIDTTLSMQPEIDVTREAVRDIIAKIGDTAVKDNFRFGVVAYRDSLEDNPGLEYPTKVFAKPDFSNPPEAVLPAMAGLGESHVSSTGFDEDPIGGIKTALDEMDWNNLGGRYIVLITDAGARLRTHPHSITGLGISEIRDLAQQKQVALATFHLLTQAGAVRHDHELARDQYMELTRFGSAQPLYYPVADASMPVFRQQMQGFVQAVLQRVAETTGVPLASLQSPGTRPDPTAARMADQLRLVSEAMKLSYLGRVEDARAPDVHTSWTTDRDLSDSQKIALEVRVLLTKNQLSDLADALQKILREGLALRTSPQTFFAQLRSAFQAAATDPRRIGQFLGEFLTDLPYTSEIMDIDQDSWLQMGPIQQRVVLNHVEDKLKLYEAFQGETDLWIDITHSGLPGEKVFPVPLDALP